MEIMGQHQKWESILRYFREGKGGVGSGLLTPAVVGGREIQGPVQHAEKAQLGSQ